jgi:hypothetical protein
MSYGQLVSIESSFEVDTSNLDERLDSMQETIDGLDAMSEEKVNDLIDSEISSRDLVSSSDYDLEDMQRRVGDIDSLEERLDSLESGGVQDGALQVLEHRIEALERTRGQEATVIDLLRQLARALVS